MAFWKEVNKVSVRLAFGWILAPENLIHPLHAHFSGTIVPLSLILSDILNNPCGPPQTLHTRFNLVRYNLLRIHNEFGV